MKKSPVQGAPPVTAAALKQMAADLSPEAAKALAKAVRLWLAVKRAGGNVLVATGSGPNLHEGVTCLLAELIGLGLVDAVLTSSAVVGHEMAGCLEEVRRVDGVRAGLPPHTLPADGRVEVSLISQERLAEIERDLPLDREHYRKLLSLAGPTIIKVAGNLAYPTGLWLERVAERLLPLSQSLGLPLEHLAGLGAHPLTMLGAAAARSIPCLVTVPQLVGGGRVGLAIGDSIPISRRSALVAKALANADLIIESGVALTQEIHDGPFELYTGHGMWAAHDGLPAFSLQHKPVVRIDMDPRLARACQAEREKCAVSQAIEKGLPKNAALGIPFRMEMSGFARLPGALPIVADLGQVWPLLASRVCKGLKIKPGFLSAKQTCPAGQQMRRFISQNVKPMDLARALAAAAKL